MKRRNRLTRRRQFADLRRLRITASSGALRVHAAPNGNRPLRVGFAVSGVANAVVRNRVRRRLRALLQARSTTLTAVDLLVSAGPGAAAAPFTQLDADLSACLVRVLPRASDRSRGGCEPVNGDNGRNDQPGPAPSGSRHGHGLGTSQ